MKNISYFELYNCQDYVERVLDFYMLCNNGKKPLCIDDAEIAIREYNKEYKPFKRLCWPIIRCFKPFYH